MVLKKTKNKTKPKIKPKPKIKQKQTQKQSQKVIVNIHETKKKQTTRRKNNTKKEEEITNNGSGAVYAIPDNRAIDTLRGELNETKNKLLTITNTPNMVNQNDEITGINNNLRALSQEGNRFFGDIYKRLGNLDGENRRNFTNPSKEEELKFYKPNIGENIPLIETTEIKKRKSGAGRPKGSKNLPKTKPEETTRELRSSDKEPPKIAEQKAPFIDPDEEIMLQQQQNQEKIRKRAEERKRREELQKNPMK
jgi:hypothetical protein